MTYYQERWTITDEQKSNYILKLTPELKTLRVKAGITQDELSKAIGISRQTYCQIENRSKTMSWNTYLSLIFFFNSIEETSKLMSALDIYPDELIERINGNNNSKNNSCLLKPEDEL